MTTDILKVLGWLSKEKKVEARLTGIGEWSSASLSEALHLLTTFPKTEFRLAPETMIFNGYEIPRPSSVANGGQVGIAVYPYAGAGCSDQYLISFATFTDAKQVFAALCKPFKELS